MRIKAVRTPTKVTFFSACLQEPAQSSDAPQSSDFTYNFQHSDSFRHIFLHHRRKFFFLNGLESHLFRSLF